MKLNQTITINPPVYSDNNGNIITPNPIMLDELKITILDNLKNKTISVQIWGIPNQIGLYTNEEYDNLGEWSRQQILDKLLEKMGNNPAVFLRSLFPKTLEENPNHPGTILSKMIKSVGIKMTDSCSCKKHALYMNEQGNAWCEQNIDTIVVWLKDEAKRRNLPFMDAIGKMIVNRAIKKSKKLLANEHVPDNDEDLDNM